MARITRGKIYQRVANGKKSKYYSGQYTINKKTFRVILMDDDGNKITDQRKAEKALQKLIAPAQLSAEADRRTAHAEALKLAEVKLAEAKEQAEANAEARKQQAEDRRALKIKDAWTKYTDPGERIAPECSEQNLKNYRGYWRNFTKWLENTIPDTEYMRDVTPATAKRFACYLEQTASGNTFNKYRAFLLSFFNVLSPFIRGGENPFECIRRKEKVKAAKRRDFTLDELRAILTGATGERGLLLWIGATTGLRLGDAVTMTWSMINLDRGTIRDTNRKTGADVVIGIVPVLAEILRQMPPEQRQGYLMPTLAAEYLNPKIQPHFIARLQKYFQSCGIRTQKEGTGKGTGKRAVTEVGFHSLRHSFATICGEIGTAESVTQKLLGHSRAAMTQYYQHSNELSARATAKQLDGTFRGIIAESGTVPVEHEPERAELHRLAEELNIEAIREIITQYGSK